MPLLSRIAVVALALLLPGRSEIETREDMLHRGDAKVVLGAILGDTATMRLGVAEGGEPNAVLTELIGGLVLRLGRPHVDFPIMPALHLCMHFGHREHSNAVFDLLQKGADPNMYRLPEFEGDYGYAPAILYALGLGPTPTTQHAAVLQRVLVSAGDKFNFSATQEWIVATGNPPLSHIPALHGFTDGLYVLLSDLAWNVDEKDTHGLTPLHVAAWRGDALTVALLLTHEADRLLPDKHGRLPLHYAAMRGFTDVIELLFIPPPSNSPGYLKPAQWAKMRRSMLTHLDKDRRSALMLAALVPSVPTSVRGVRTQMTQDKLLPEGRWNRAPLRGERTISTAAEETELSGGWAGLGESYQQREERTDVDVVRADSLSRGVFRRDYFTTQRPVLISGQPLAAQAIWAYRQREALLERYGAAQVRTGEALYAERGKPDWNFPPARTLRLRDWVREQMPPLATACAAASGAEAGGGAGGGGKVGGTCVAPADRSPWLASTVTSGPTSADVLAKLRFDVRKPEVVQLCGDRDHEHMRILAGPAGSGEPLQARNASWAVVLAGAVRWMLVPPGVNASQTLRLGGERAEESPAEYRVLSAAAWSRDVAPSIRAKGLLFEVTQHPGEGLFVPAGWHALSLLQADSLVLRQEFCTLLNTDQRVQPLGLAVYGGNDSFRGFGRTKYEYRLQPKPLEPRSRVPSFD